jgi:hypothetical protein
MKYLLRPFCLIVIAGFFLIQTYSSCNSGPEASIDNHISLDTSKIEVVVDSSKMSIEKMFTGHLTSTKIALSEPGSDAGDPRLILFTGENFTGESDTIRVDQYYQSVQQSFTGSRLSKFSVTGIRSIKLPFGLCADILYATNLYQTTARPPGGLLGKVIQNLQINRYYSPGNYSTIEPVFSKPVMVTLYPWTDFYFSTDDPAVPAQIQYIGLKFTSNFNDYNKLGDSVKFSSTKEVYTKSYSYQLPQGRTAKVWEASINGGNSSWDSNTDNANRLTVNLHINNNAIFTSRNWVGVRAALKLVQQ